MQGTPSPLRAYARSAGTLALVHAASMALTFAIGIFLARLLGASAYGIYGLAMAVAALAGMTAEMGLPILVVREIAAARATGQWDPVRGLLRWAERVIGLLALMLAVPVLALAMLHPRAGESSFLAAILWAIALIPATALGRLKGNALLAAGHSLAGQFPVLVLRPLLFLLGLAAIWLGEMPLTPALAMAAQAGTAIAALLAASLIWRRLRPADLRRARPVQAARQWTRACLPMGMTEGLRLLQAQAPILLLGLLATPREAGLYRVADSLVLAVAIGQSVLALAVSPQLAALKAADDRAQLQRILKLSALGMMLSTLLLGLPIALLGGDFLALLFGHEFRQSLAPFLIAWLGMVLSGALGPVHVHGNMTGHQGLVTLAYVISVAACLAISLWAIPRLGAVGAAVGLAGGMLISGLWLWHMIRRRDGLDCSAFSREALSQIWPLRRTGIPAGKTVDRQG